MWLCSIACISFPSLGLNSYLLTKNFYFLTSLPPAVCHPYILALDRRGRFQQFHGRILQSSITADWLETKISSFSWVRIFSKSGNMKLTTLAFQATPIRLFWEMHTWRKSLSIPQMEMWKISNYWRNSLKKSKVELQHS